MHVNYFFEPVKRSFLQALILKEKFINGDNSRILDIGCFDGQLLLELDKIYSHADLWGLDINSHLNAIFPDRDNFHFVSTGFKDINGPFDLITLSHSMFYIQNLPELMLSISRLLKNDGILFIQIPDISKNPYYLLMGDQNFIFTEISLKNVLSNFGYRVEVVKNDYFPRELLITAQKEGSPISINFLKDNVFEESIETLNRVKMQLENINDLNLTVLGTTVNAAFVDEIKGRKILFFVDENPSNIGRVFRRKKVLHPEELNNEHHTILPYGESGIKILNKCRELYRGSFTLIGN